MKILLIRSNSTKEGREEYIALQYPINLGYIASVLMEEGHEVKMLDFNVIERKKLPVFISKYNPELVGLTSVTPNIYNVRDIINETKKINRKIITVLGGVHASVLPLETMKEIQKLDYIIFGEGEKTIVELVDHLINKKNLKNVKGLVFRKKGKIIKNKPRELIEDLDTIPYPSRDLVPLKLYSRAHVVRGFSRKELRIVEIMTSRGCPNSCIFCAGHINYGHRVRFRSYENIINEIKECIDKYEINHIDIEDDTFTLNKKLVKQVCDFLKKQNVTWNCCARVDTVDYDLLRTMAKSGCKLVLFGVESGNPGILKKIKKGITIPKVIKAVREAKKAGIRYVECDFMIGSHPDETFEDVSDTVKLIYKLMPDFLAVSVMCPFPGTEVYDIMKSKGHLYEKTDWSQLTLFGNLNRYKRVTHMTLNQMYRLQHKILKEYYTSPKYIIPQLIQIRTLGEIKYLLRMGILFLKEFIFKKPQNGKKLAYS